MERPDADIIRLFGDEDGGEALKRWVDRLGPYLDERKAVESVRHRAMPQAPWPSRDNPMLGYLIERANEVLDSEGAASALVWLAVHAWFEGAIDQRFRTVQGLVDS